MEITILNDDNEKVASIDLDKYDTAQIYQILELIGEIKGEIGKYRQSLLPPEPKIEYYDRWDMQRDMLSWRDNY